MLIGALLKVQALLMSGSVVNWKGQCIVRPAMEKLLVVVPNIKRFFRGLFFPLCSIGTPPPKHTHTHTLLPVPHWWHCLDCPVLCDSSFSQIFLFLASHSLESAHLPAPTNSVTVYSQITCLPVTNSATVYSQRLACPQLTVSTVYSQLTCLPTTNSVTVYSQLTCLPATNSVYSLQSAHLPAHN